MLPALRRARIIEFIRRDGAAGLKEMSESLGVSVSTLRRDVDYLCDQGQLERTHGGAIRNEGRRLGVELDRDIAFELESDAKRAIGLRAATMIQPGQTVIIDSGTTTAALARAARERGISFHAITNDLGIAGILSEGPAVVSVTVTGGRVRTGTNTLLGTDTVESITRLHADLAFVGTHALSELEMSDTSIELATLKRAMIGAAQRVVLLADSSKIFSRSFCSFGRVDDLELLISDNRLTSDQRTILAENGLNVDLVVPAGTTP
jgi:DeoR/GlpR family transcriptional regulator of sugar metabolism